MLATKTEKVRHQAHRTERWIDVGPSRDVFLQDVVLHRPGDSHQVGALTFRHGKIQGDKDRRCGVDGHGRGNAAERDAVEKRLHVFEGVNGDTRAAHFATRKLVVGIETDLRGQVESHGESRLALRKEIPETGVRFDRRPVASVLPHGPKPAPILRGVNAAGKRVFAGKAGLVAGVMAGGTQGPVAGFHLNPRGGTEFCSRRKVSIRLFRIAFFHDRRLIRCRPAPSADASRFQERKQAHDNQKYREAAKYAEPQPIFRGRLAMQHPLFERYNNADRRHNEKGERDQRMAQPPRLAVPSGAEITEPVHDGFK